MSSFGKTSPSVRLSFLALVPPAEQDHHQGQAHLSVTFYNSVADCLSPVCKPTLESRKDGWGSGVRGRHI